MSSDSTENGKMSKSDTELVLRDLESIFRKSVGDEVNVINYASDNLLPLGENYSSTIFKVDLVIKRNKDSHEENLSLVAKMIPNTAEFQRTHFVSTIAFRKEIFVYSKLVPALRELEKKIGVRDEDLLDITPKYYGGRLSINRNKLNVADEDAVMFLENLKERGYYTLNRKRGLDLDHAKLAIRKLARFHALSMALKLKKTISFEEAENSLNMPTCDSPYGMEESDFNEVTNYFMAYQLSSICEQAGMAKYEGRIRASMEACKNWAKTMRNELKEPWVAVSHGDFWVNNILFQQENGRVKDTKFVDFQLTELSSPMKDLPFFLMASVKMDVIDDHFDDLLDAYYNKLIAVLTKTGCDIRPFTRKSFDEQLSKDANIELLHCLFATKFFTLEISDDLASDITDMINSVLTSKPSKSYLERARLIIRKYVEKGWV